MTDWAIHHSHGDAGAFHAIDPAPARTATFHTVDVPTLVLGSAQHDADVDGRVARALGVEVVRRRSGGGAVLLVPGEFVWLDVVIPAGDPLWRTDVAQAMVWVGDLWRRALAHEATTVHVDAMARADWSRHVCWAGVGTGELMLGDSKVVGIAQRRTRDLARFQTMCHLRWRPELVTALVSPPRPTAAEAASWAVEVQVAATELQSTLVAVLPR